MTRTYTRAARATANVLLLAFLGMLYASARGSGLVGALIALLIAAPALVCYGYYVASQHCARCRESIFGGDDPHGVLGEYIAFITPLRVPLQCPHCRALTPWTLVRDGKHEDAD